MPNPDEARDYRAPLNGLFWTLLLVFTPAAVVWAFKLPRNHPQKVLALATSLGALALAFALLGVAIWTVVGILRVLAGAY